MWKKIVLGQKNYSNFELTETYKKIIKKHISNSYNLEDERFPLSICATCRLVLHQHDKNDCKRPLSKMPNHESILLPKTTRINNVSTEGYSTCNCSYA